MSPEGAGTFVGTVTRVLGPATGGAADVQDNYGRPLRTVAV